MVAFVYAKTPPFANDPFFTRGVSQKVVTTLKSPEYQKAQAADPHFARYNEFLETARALTAGSGALLLLDEIQSGMGRTGEWFAYQHYGVQPDVVTVAKPIAGGLALGAILTTNDAASCLKPGMHGTTFGGGPLACAVACTVIDQIEKRKLVKSNRELGKYFVKELKALRKKHSRSSERECVTEARSLLDEFVSGVTRL